MATIQSQPNLQPYNQQQQYTTTIQTPSQKSQTIIQSQFQQQNQRLNSQSQMTNGHNNLNNVQQNGYQNRYQPTISVDQTDNYKKNGISNGSMSKLPYLIELNQGKIK